MLTTRLQEAIEEMMDVLGYSEAAIMQAISEGLPEKAGQIEIKKLKSLGVTDSAIESAIAERNEERGDGFSKTPTLAQVLMGRIQTLLEDADILCREKTLDDASQGLWTLSLLVSALCDMET